MKINIFCKSSLRREALRKLRSGELREMVLEHIERFGKSSNDEYNVRVHGGGSCVTIGNADWFNN